MGFVFARIGEAGEHQPGLALLLSAGLPPLIWGLFRAFYRQRAKRGESGGEVALKSDFSPSLTKKACGKKGFLIQTASGSGIITPKKAVEAGKDIRIQ